MKGFTLFTLRAVLSGWRDEIVNRSPARFFSEVTILQVAHPTA